MDLLEANPQYAVIKDRRGNTKTVSTQDLAPFPRPNTLNTREEQTQDFDELASKYVVKYYYVIIISLYEYSFLEYIKLHVTEFYHNSTVLICGAFFCQNNQLIIASLPEGGSRRHCHPSQCLLHFDGKREEVKLTVMARK